MKFTLKTFIIISLLVSTIACENTEIKKEDPEKTEVKSVPASSESKMVLDDGNRWTANQETTEGINSMIAFTNSFTDYENIASYNALSDSLNSAFNLILKQCTMDGAAHDQLHNFLFPMKAKFKILAADDLNEAKVAYEDLKKHLALYSVYFQ
jgi:hypothetical protein